MEIIDTHTHVFLEEFDNDRIEVYNRARENQISTLILPNIEWSTIERLTQAQQLNNMLCRVAVGLHPCSVKENYKEELQKLKPLVTQLNAVAIGETGIDLYWDKTFLTEQIDSFTQQCLWGMEFKKPVIIHIRESFNETFDALDKVYTSGLTGVFHCFTGTEEQAQKALSFEGFYLGIGGVLTYKNTTLREVLKTIPTNRLVFETDAPYLAPVPHRGKRNEPSFIIHVLQQAAETLNVTPEQLAAITTENAKRLFNL